VLINGSICKDSENTDLEPAYCHQSRKMRAEGWEINAKGMVTDSQALLHHTHLLFAACGFVLAIFTKPMWRDLL
jgi:hypothetical protein